MYEYIFKPTRVVDGDTVDGNIDLGFGINISKRLRLLGIDTPETRTRDLEEKKRGFEAKDYLIGLLDKATKVKIVTENDSTGKYGRVLATLYVEIDGWINVNSTLLKEGYAKVYE
jgi:micrococcal nuclease